MSGLADQYSPNVAKSCIPPVTEWRQPRIVDQGFQVVRKKNIAKRHKIPFRFQNSFRRCRGTSSKNT